MLQPQLPTRVIFNRAFKRRLYALEDFITDCRDFVGLKSWPTKSSQRLQLVDVLLWGTTTRVVKRERRHYKLKRA